MTSLVNESLDANGEATWPMIPVPAMPVPVLKIAGQIAAGNKAQLGNESSFGVCILRGAEKNTVDVNWIFHLAHIGDLLVKIIIKR